MVNKAFFKEQFLSGGGGVWLSVTATDGSRCTSLPTGLFKG